MFPSSDRFSRSIQRSHDVATTCTVVDANDTPVASLDVIGGNVSLDATQATRRQCTLDLQDPTGEIVPDLPTDFLQPYSGYYLQIARGISWRDGTSEMFPLGTFASFNPDIKDNGNSLAIKVNGFDRSKIISATRWTDPYPITDGTPLGDAVRNAIDNRMPGLRYNLEPTNYIVPATTLGLSTQNDPWADIVGIASAGGMDLFFDANDIVTMRTIPDYTLGSIVRYFEEGPNCTVTEFDRVNSADEMYTGVIVYSEGSGVTVPIRVAVWDPTTDLRIPYFFPTALITTEAQALQTGQSLLRRVGRSKFSVGLSIIPDPRHELGDIINIKRTRMKLNDAFVVNTATIPLDSNSTMHLGTAPRRTG